MKDAQRKRKEVKEQSTFVLVLLEVARSPGRKLWNEWREEVLVAQISILPRVCPWL